MPVSHYLVSWIQVCGLIIGLDGFFFLSLSIFGRASTPWFRALLPATGAGLGILLVAQTARAPSTSIPPAIGWGLALLIVVWTYIAAAIGLWTALPKEYQSVEKVARIATLGGMIGATITYFVALIVGLFEVTTGNPELADGLSLGYMAGLLLLGWSIVSLERLPRAFTEERLQKVGFVLSAIAVLTQFIPPVLDLLNIPVK